MEEEKEGKAPRPLGEYRGALLDSARSVIEAMPGIEAELSEYLKRRATSAKELSQGVSSKATMVERIIILAAGTFILSLNFTAAATDQLSRKGLAGQLGNSAHYCLYFAWALLLVAIFACAAAWITVQFDSLRYEGIRKLIEAQEDSRHFRSLVNLLGPIFSMASAAGAVFKGHPDDSVDAGRITRMLHTIASSQDKKNSENQVELEKMKFPARIYSWLLFISLLAVPTALTLLFAFALRVTGLLLR